MKSNTVKTGDFLFKHRSFTPLPVIILVLVFLKPDQSDNLRYILPVTGLILAVLGELIRVAAVGFSFKGTSGRESFLKADSLNTTGIYSVVRNPLYIGNFFMFLGLILSFGNIAGIIIVSFFLIIQYRFIIASEEFFLVQKYKDEYRAYQKRVNKIIPDFSSYVKPVNKFNLKKVILKENDSVFNMFFMFLAILLYRESEITGSLTFNNPVVYCMCIAVLIYVVFKIIKKKSKISL